MTRSPTVISIAVALLLVSVPAESHHSYAGYERRLVEIEGVVESLDWANPHVILRVRGTDGALYTAEWLSLRHMSRVGITREMVTTGERVVISGLRKRDELTLVNIHSIRRSSDGWSWRNSSQDLGAPLRVTP